MNFQGALGTLVGAFMTFYIGSALVGRVDIPWRIIGELRSKAVAGTHASWGCPSAFHPRTACKEYNPNGYK